ncbi:hypothetical protein ACJ72_00334 [Emergomyces africanus]|uniref:DUF7580 domain-containing protein n=1 Tax=Emergomyces africanus TaxID=1955775 RepID=A0A1B7P8F4_9EURO|nr:hypothetical protein ACJ72_00334 [Emergomyces africanus]
MLGRSYEPYIATIADMNDALEAIKEILHRHQETPGSKSRRARRLGFTLSRHKREELLDRISRNNNLLAALFEQRQRLEVNKRRATCSGYRRIRQHCIKLYHALSQAWRCCCNTGHITNLHLPTLMIANQMTLPSHIKLQMIFQAMSERNKDVTTKWQWQQAYIQSLEMQTTKPLQTPVSTSSVSSAKPIEKLTSLKPKKKVAFAWPSEKPQPSSQATSTSTISTSTISTATTLALSVVAAKPPSPPLTPTNDQSGLIKISDLCATLSSPASQKSPSSSPSSCIGYLQDTCSGLHKLHLVPSNTKWEVISLHELIRLYLSNTSSSPLILAGSHKPSTRPQVKPLTRKERFKLAVALSTSVLQFDDTPWLKQHWGTDDIHFFLKPSSSMSEQAYLTTVFSQSNHVPTKKHNCTSFPPLVRNKALFTLGIVLIELAFGKPLEDLRTQKDIDESRGMPDLVDTFTVKRLLESVEDEAGYDYSEAVRRCIECPFDGKEARFTNESFQEAVHDWIIEPLRVSFNNFSGSMNEATT